MGMIFVLHYDKYNSFLILNAKCHCGVNNKGKIHAELQGRHKCSESLRLRGVSNDRVSHNQKLDFSF